MIESRVRVVEMRFMGSAASRLVSGGIEKGISFINNTMLIFRKRGWNFLNENEQKFLMLFGREPTSDDLTFFRRFCSRQRLFRKCITFLRNLGLPKEWIYAFYRTDGLMPTVENEKFLSQSDIELFRGYCHEYTELMDADFGSVGSMLFFLPPLRMRCLNLLATIFCLLC